MNNTTVTAPEIACGGCAIAIKNALEKIDGVTEVNVDVETKKVSVEHDEMVSRLDIVEALDTAGFSAG